MMTFITAKGSSTRTASGQAGGTFRPEIGGLRAFAVVAVIGYHFFPEHLRGGFVGVDVFFAISGFLIGGHLLQELKASGRIQLKRFWGRRMRRLLPSSLLVLVVVAASAWWLVPPFQWRDTAAQLVGSTFYAQNWVLTAQSVDYLQSGSAPTALQHYWSLSVEEQFYLVLPLILVGVVLFARRIRVARLLPTAIVALGVIALISVAASILYSGDALGASYFSTLIRAWEFLAGVFLALLLPRLRGRHPESRSTVTAGFIAAAGWMLLMVSIFAIDTSVAFPGWIAAVPILGTALVIVGGTPSNPGAVRLYSARTVQTAGILSYQLYLWHWPVRILLLPKLEALVGEPTAIAIALLLILALSYVSHRTVERAFWKPPLIPKLHDPKLRAQRRVLLPNLAFTAGTVLLATALLISAHALTGSQRADLAAYLHTSPTCWGPKNFSTRNAHQTKS